MSLASNIRAGAAYVELFTEDNQFVRGLNAAKKRLETFGKSATDIGKKMLGAGAFIGAPFLAGVKVFADFEQEMAMVSTALEKPRQYMETFSKGIRDMSVDFGESTGVLAKALHSILEASVPPQRALNVLKVSAKAAKGGLTDVGTAADTITTILNAYGLSASKAADVSDWLFAIAKNGRTSFAELAGSIGPIASLAGTVGLSMNELGAAIALMTKKGLKTEGAINAIQGVILSFISPSKDAAEAARALGFNMSSATLRSEGLAKIFDKIKTLPPETLSKLFPDKTLKGILPLLRNMGEFTGNIYAMNKRAGTTESAYSKMSNTLSMSFARLKQAGVEILTVLGETLSKPIKKAADITLKYVKTIIQWMSENKRLLVTVAAIAGVIGTLGAVLLGVAVAAKTVAVIFGIISGAFALLGSTIGVIGSILAAIATPVGITVVAITVLGAAILYFTGLGAKVLAWLGEKFQILKEFALESWRGITDALMSGNFQLAAKILWDSLKVAWLTGTNELKRYWVEFSAWYQHFTSEVFYGAVSIITDAWASLKTAWSNTVSFLSDIWNIFLNELKSAWNTSQAWLQKRWLSFMGIFDKRLDVEAAYKLVDEELNQKNTESQGQLDKALLESSAKANKDNAATEATRKSIQDIIAKSLVGDLAQINSEAAQSIKESQDALDKAKAEWKSAIDEAKAQNENKKGGGKIDKLQEQLRTVPKVDAVRSKVEVAGSFYANSARALSSGTVADRTAKAIEDTAKNTKKTNQLLEKQSSSSDFVFE